MIQVLDNSAEMCVLSLLLNSDPVACCSKVNVSVGWKGKVYLLRRPVTWGKGGLMSKRQLSTADQGARAFRGELQGYIGREWWLRVESHSQLYHLDIGHEVV